MAPLAVIPGWVYLEGAGKLCGSVGRTTPALTGEGLGAKAHITGLVVDAGASVEAG